MAFRGAVQRLPDERGLRPAFLFVGKHENDLKT